MSNVVIETDRLLLRVWRDADLEPMSRVNQDPRVLEYLPRPLSLDETREFIDRFKVQYREHGYTLYAVELKATGEFIGYTGLNYFSLETPFAPVTEIGWRLGSEFWGNGYATEGAKAVLSYAFKQLKLDRVISVTVPANKRSLRVMEKIGLKYVEDGEFDYPNFESDSPLLRHVLYPLGREEFR